MIYLASVYSLDATTDSVADRLTRQMRYNTVMMKAAELLKAGEKVFSPITHCHPMSCTYNMPASFEFWMELDEDYIRHCDKVLVYRMKGWERSKGITHEIAYAESLGIPVEYID
jgi:hypothetical protein